MNWKEKVKKLKKDCVALYLAVKHPKTPWYAKVIAAIVVAYMFSPIDLIPDFIPVIGYLDEIILMPFCIMLLLKIIPKDVMEQCRENAEYVMSKPKSFVGASCIILIWLALAYFSVKIFIDIKT